MLTVIATAHVSGYVTSPVRDEVLTIVVSATASRYTSARPRLLCQGLDHLISGWGKEHTCG